jgi:four helix bundle protein
VTYKFEQLEVWRLALDYIDLIYKVAENLPRSEEYNLKSQITRAATSIALNIAEGSQGQSDAEQARFLGMAIRSLIETVACQEIIRRRGYFQDETILNQDSQDSQTLAGVSNFVGLATEPTEILSFFSKNSVISVATKSLAHPFGHSHTG